MAADMTEGPYRPGMVAHFGDESVTNILKTVIFHVGAAHLVLWYMVCWYAPLARHSTRCHSTLLIVSAV
jgi:hypothetical protein